ncbi:MAG: hypothetical protein PHC28_13720 [Flavobacterium sp.]|uniref:hypothetical protein n=1 Tax=Flavobacterium sp. TaxID=239 RepID=UPI002639F1E3|nr:hypothetical protein [Flavobacterium sp.]MDD5151511.1 hypothetical protein [Flavobacterium sp.]
MKKIFSKIISNIFKNQDYSGKWKSIKNFVISNEFGNREILSDTLVTVIKVNSKNEIYFEILPWADKNVTKMSITEFKKCFIRIS